PAACAPPERAPRCGSGSTGRPWLLGYPSARNPSARAGASATGTLGALRVTAQGQSEGAALGVLADRPQLARMAHAAAERPHLSQCARQALDLEVGQGERVPGPASALVHADRRCMMRLGLPALTLAAGLERDAEQAGPEAARPARVIGGKL